METFSALLALCAGNSAGNSPVTGEFPAQRPVTRSFVVFFDLRLDKRLSKQSWGWWFETLSRPLWRHRNDAMPVRFLQYFLTHWDEKMVATLQMSFKYWFFANRTLTIKLPWNVNRNTNIFCQCAWYCLITGWHFVPGSICQKGINQYNCCTFVCLFHS